SDRLERMVKEIADVSDRQPRAIADLLVRKIFVEAKYDEFAAANVERFHRETNEPDAFPARNLLVRHGLRVAGIVNGVLPFGVRGFEEGDLAGAPLMIDRQVVHRAIQPRLRRAYLMELGV